MPPIFFPVCIGFSNDPKCCCFPRRQASTSEHRAGGGWYSTHDLLCGSGKFVLKYDVRLEAARKNLPFLKAREITSAMMLSSPATCFGTMFDALAACIRSPSIRNNLPAVRLLEVRSLYAHATADMLSQNVTRCAYWRFPIRCSRMRKANTAPASSSVLMEIVPVGFSRVTRARCMSAGHSNFHRNGSRGCVPEHQTPPAPNPHASV